MTTLHPRAWRTAIAVIVSLHVANCPSVSSGPETGCVRSGKLGGVNDGAAIETIGRLYPELPSSSPVVILRLDETPGGVFPTAQYIDKYQPTLTDPLTILPQLGIDECQCIRGNGQVCDADAGAPPATTPGTPVGCAPIAILGIDPHAPASGFQECIRDSECSALADGGVDGGASGSAISERCVERKCTVPLILAFDDAQRKYVVPGGRITAAGSLEGLSLNIELQPQMGSSSAGTCPTSTATAPLRTVTRTVISTPLSSASITRGQDLIVGWESVEGSPASFVMVLVRGTRMGEARTLLCRSLDLEKQVTVQGWQLARLDPGVVELEVQRLNAVGIVAPPTQGGSILSVSTRTLPLTLR